MRVSGRGVGPPTAAVEHSRNCPLFSQPKMLGLSITGPFPSVHECIEARNAAESARLDMDTSQSEIALIAAIRPFQGFSIASPPISLPWE